VQRHTVYASNAFGPYERKCDGDETNDDSPKQLLNTLICPNGHTGGGGIGRHSEKPSGLDRGRRYGALGDDNSNFTVHGRDGYFSCEFEGCRYTVSVDDVEYEEVSSFGL